MRTRPILFNGDMVRAILDGCKTQTRRPIKMKFNPRGYRVDFENGCAVFSHRVSGCWHVAYKVESPYQIGDLLWVRESATVVTRMGAFRKAKIRYEADGTTAIVDYPSRLAPIPIVGHKLANGTYKEASRMTLLVTGVRVERLCNCSESDAIAEGITDPLPLTKFLDLWESIYKNVEQNPWVWIITFKRLESV